MRILSRSMRFLFFLVMVEIAYHGLAHADIRGNLQHVEDSSYYTIHQKQDQISFYYRSSMGYFSERPALAEIGRFRQPSPENELMTSLYWRQIPFSTSFIIYIECLLTTLSRHLLFQSFNTHHNIICRYIWVLAGYAFNIMQYDMNDDD